jgi:hypothetical protein
MSCDPLIIELYTGVPGAPGAQGAQGPQGPAGPAGTVTDITGDITVDEENVGTVVGIQSVPVATDTPTANQIFAFDGTNYKPTTFTAGTY